MKIVTSATVFRDAVGMRLSYTFSEVDESGHIISDNNRANKVLTDATEVQTANDLIRYAKESMTE